MGTKISDITNKYVQQLATKIDNEFGNKNNELDGTEISIFENQTATLIDSGVVDKDYIDNLLGKDIAKKNSTVTTPDNNTKEYSKKDKKHHKKYVTDQVKKYINYGFTPAEVLSKIQEYCAKDKYADSLDAVETVYELVAATNYKSKDDVEKIHDTVKAKLKELDKWDNFHQEILKEFEKAAEEEQIQNETKALIEKYKSIKATMENTDIVKEKGHNFSEYIKIIKDELETKDTNGKKPMNTSYTKKAFERLETYARSDAQSNAEIKLFNSEAESKKGIKKEVSKDIKQTSNDEYQLDAVNKLKKDRKILARRNKVENKAEDMTHLTYEEIKEEIGKRSNQYNFMKKVFKAHKIGDRIFEKLDNAYLDKIKNEDGTYDLTKLKDELLSRIGSDYTLNQSSTKAYTSELVNLKNHLREITGEEFTDNEAKVLVNMFDFKREHRDRTPKAFSAIKSGIGSALSAYNASPNINVRQHMELVINKNVSQNLINILKEQGVVFDETKLDGENIQIVMKQGVKYNHVVRDALKGLGIGVLTSAILDFVIGDKRDEKICMSLTDYDINSSRYTNVEEYKKYVANVFEHNPAKVEALHFLIDTYKDKYGDDFVRQDGTHTNWHAEFQNNLRKHAGFGSNMNPDECRMLKYQVVEEKIKQNEQFAKEEDKPQTSPVTQPQTQPQQQPVVVPKPCYVDMTPSTFEYKRKGGDTWAGLVNAFYKCLAEDNPMYNVYKIKNGKKVLVKEGAITKLKKALSYDKNGNFDKETFIKLRDGGDLPAVMYLPKEIEGCIRNDDGKVAKAQVHGSGKAKINRVGYGSYIAEDGCNGTKAQGRTKQEALTKLKTINNNKKYANEADIVK